MDADGRTSASRGLSFVDAHICPWYPNPSRPETARAVCRQRTGVRGRRGNSRAPLGQGRVLDRFLSHFTNRFDAKGRVSIPAPFRAVLAKDGFDGIFVHPSLDAPALDCGGHMLLREIDALLAVDAALLAGAGGLGDGAARHQRGPAPRFGGSHSPERDECRASLGLKDEAVFVGHGHKFQIWEPVRFRGASRGGQARVRRLRAEFGARPAQAVQGARE